MKTYTGRRTEQGVMVEVSRFNRRGRKITRPLRHIPFHSPSGFEWSFAGSGPADLALALLIDHLRHLAHPTDCQSPAPRCPKRWHLRASQIPSEPHAQPLPRSGFHLTMHAQVTNLL